MRKRSGAQEIDAFGSDEQEITHCPALVSGIIGFDGLVTGLHSNPPLTTIEPDFRLAGQMLVDAALGRLEAKASSGVPVKLVERGSLR